MSTEDKANTGQKGRARWARSALLAYTLAGPAIGAWMRRARQGSQTAKEAILALPEVTQSRQAEFRERLEELTRESRQRATEQAQHLRAQAGQLRDQSRQLRKAVRDEARQRRKLLAQMRDSGIEWSQDVLKRGEELKDDLVERGGEITHDLSKRGRKVSRDLAKRSRKASRDLTKRGRKLSRDLSKRSKAVLETQRDQNTLAWSIAGFGVGLVIAGAITYRLLRSRALKQAEEEDQAIELPSNGVWNGSTTHPAGEIYHVDGESAIVATLEAVTVANTERPENAAYVGVLSTKNYYPVDTELELTDVVFFISEDEAQNNGFKAAE